VVHQEVQEVAVLQAQVEHRVLEVLQVHQELAEHQVVQEQAVLPQMMGQTQVDGNIKELQLGWTH
jgi:hypothetical protein